MDRYNPRIKVSKGTQIEDSSKSESDQHVCYWYGHYSPLFWKPRSVLQDPTIISHHLYVKVGILTHLKPRNNTACDSSCDNWCVGPLNTDCLVCPLVIQQKNPMYRNLDTWECVA